MTPERLSVIEAAARPAGGHVPELVEIQHGLSLEDAYLHARAGLPWEPAPRTARSDWHGIRFGFEERSPADRPQSVDVVHVHDEPDGVLAGAEPFSVNRRTGFSCCAARRWTTWTVTSGRCEPHGRSTAGRRGGRRSRALRPHPPARRGHHDGGPAGRVRPVAGPGREAHRAERVRRPVADPAPAGPAPRDPFSAVLSLTEQGLLPAARIAEELGVPGLPAEVVARTRDKLAMRTRLRDGDSPPPRARSCGAPPTSGTSRPSTAIR